MRVPAPAFFCLSLLPLACKGDVDPASTDTTGASSTAGTSSEGSSSPTTTLPPTTDSGATGAGTGTGEISGTTSGTTTGDTGATTADTTGDASTGTGDATSGDASTTAGPDDPVYDPAQDGPYTFDELADEIQVGQAMISLIAYYPTSGPTAGPFPVVTLAHGFNIAPTQYTAYAKRLATHGYVAINVDHTGYLLQPVHHVNNAKQVLGALDWAAAHATLKSIADVDLTGTTGHSLGGKISVLAATLDPRVKASITLDPVDGANMCPNQMACPDVSAMLPLAIPLGFLGETLDSQGGFMNCAPAAENYLTFYDPAAPPALAVTIHGASHVSFVNDIASCGFACSFCKAATLDSPTVNNISKAYLVAFFGRYLRDNPGYDTYLTGADAIARYVDKGWISVESK